MNSLQLSWKNLKAKPLQMLLTLLLFALGVGLIALLVSLNKQLEEKFQNNLAGIDLVIGAKGSPLQMILSSMYHIDAPTGNISIKEVKPFFNPKHPLIKMAVPLSLGDSYRTHRIIGTTHSYVDSIFRGEIAEGRLWNKVYEVTIGSHVRRKTGLNIGDRFHSSHGFVDDGINTHDHGKGFVVVGILAPTATVLDQLILTSTQSVWAVHDHEAADKHTGDSHVHTETTEHSSPDTTSEDHEDGPSSIHHQENHDHDHEHNHDHNHDHDHATTTHQASHSSTTLLNEKPLTDYEDKDITSLLIRYRNKKDWRALNMPRNINENTDLQAASPAIEMNRLYAMMGVGTDALQYLAMIIVFVSGLSIFISLYSSLKDRKYELSLMRVMGAGRFYLFLIIILEGLILAILGYLLGMLLAHGGMIILSDYLEEAYQYQFSGWRFFRAELYLLSGALIVGLLAAIIPAWRAYRTDISDTLTTH